MGTSSLSINFFLMSFSFRRLLSFVPLLVFVLLSKAQTVEVNGLSYVVDSKSQTASLVGSTTFSSSDLVIDDSFVYDGVSYSVTSVGRKAFISSSISSVTIPNSVILIGDQAFYNCSALRRVIIEDGASLLTFNSPSSSCFGSSNDSSKNLRSLYVGRSLDFTYYSPFSYQPNLSDVTIGPLVSSLPSNFLDHDSSLTSITIPSNVQSLGGSAFDFCENLSSVTFVNEGSKLISIPSYGFRGCSKLVSISIPASTRSIDDHAFSGCSSLESIYIPASVDSVMHCAFDNCTNLRSVIIADGISSIFFNNQTEGGCFKNCPIESLYLGRSITKFFINVDPPFGDIPTLKSVVIGDKVTTLDSSLFQNDVSLTSIVIPGSVNTISARTFFNCSSLRSIVFEPSDVSIYFSYPGISVFKDCPVEDLTIKRPLLFDDTTDYPFANKSSLKTVSFSNFASLSQSKLFSNSAVEKLFIDVDFDVPSGVVLFSDLPNLHEVEFGEHVTSIPAGVFADCSSLEHIVCLPQTPPSLDGSNFKGLSLSVLVPEGRASAYRAVPSWNNEGKNLIYSSNEESLDVNLDVTPLASLAEQLSVAGYLTLRGHFNESNWSILSGMKQLVSLDLSATDITSVPAHQFENKNLISISIPSTVVSIGDYAFANNTGLASDFAFSGKVSIGRNAFAGCSKLANVTFAEPSSVHDEIILSDFAFANTAIGSVSLPASLKSLGIGVWKGCSKLTSFSIAENLRYHVADGVVYDGDHTLYQGLTGIGDSFEIPSTVKVLAPYAFADLTNLKSVSIPESVLIIGNSCFENCKLSTVQVARFEPLYIDASVFNGVAVDKVNLEVKPDPAAGKVDYSVLFYRNPYNDCDRYVENPDGSFTKYTESQNNWSIFPTINGKTVVPSGDDDDDYYSISISSPSHGTVSLSSGTNPSQVQPGQSVTITFVPDDGYYVESAIVDGTNITNYLSSYKYSFNMPSHNVSISAQFAPLAYAIRLGDTEHGTISADATSAVAGTVVTLTNAPDAGYVFDAYVSSDVTISADGKFTMPANDVTVTARFVPNTFAVKVEPSDFAEISASAESSVVGDTVILSYKDVVSGYQFKSWVIEGATLCNDSCFVMPASNVMVTALFEAIPYSITVDQPANGTVTVAPASAVAGDTVCVAYQPADGYAFDKWVLDDVTIAPEGYFVMPAHDVTVSALFVAVPYSITIVPADFGTISCSNENAVIGDTIRVTANPAEGYAFDAWKVEGAVVTNEGYFLMPAQEVKVSATFKPILFAINVASSDNGLVSCSKGNAYMGDTIRVSYMAAEGYAFDSWLADGLTITNEGFFLMPAHDVTVAAKFTAILYPITLQQPDFATIVCSKGSAVIGETVSLQVTDIKPGYSFKGWKVTGVEVSDEGMFTMPAHAIDVMAEFVPVEYTITLEQPANGKISSDKQVAIVGDVVNLTFEETVAGYAFDQWTFEPFVKIEQNTFTMPASDVKISASFKAIPYAVHVDDLANGTVLLDKEAYFVGDVVKMHVKPAEGYELVSLCIDGMEILPSFEFTMPAHDVVVEAVFERIRYSITLSDDFVDGFVFCNGQAYVGANSIYGAVGCNVITAQEGDEVTLSAYPYLGGKELVFDHWMIEGVTLTADELSNPVITFTMPAGGVIVSAVFSDITGLAFETIDRSAVLRDGGLVLSGLSTNESVYIYGINGQLLLNTKADEESVVIPVGDFDTNVVIVKTSNLIKKILIN